MFDPNLDPTVNAQKQIHFYKLFFGELLKQRASIVQSAQQGSQETSNQNK